MTMFNPRALFIQQAGPTHAFEKFNDSWESHKNEKSPRLCMKAFLFDSMVMFMQLEVILYVLNSYIIQLKV